MAELSITSDGIGELSPACVCVCVCKNLVCSTGSTTDYYGRDIA